MSNDNNENEEEIDPQRVEKLKALAKRSTQALHTFMAEAAEIVMGEKEREHIEKKVRDLFAERGLTFSLPQLSAFLEGKEFGSGAIKTSEEMTISVMVVLRKLVENRKKEVARKTPTI